MAEGHSLPNLCENERRLCSPFFYSIAVPKYVFVLKTNTCKVESFAGRKFCDFAIFFANRES